MEINWEQLWLESKRGSVLEKRPEDLEIAVYDRGAEVYSAAIKEKNHEYRQILEYGQQIVDVLKDIIKPDFAVFDIGTGPGTLVIPLAKVVKTVVALDHSKGLINALEESAVADGIANIATITKTWQEVDDIVERAK